MLLLSDSRSCSLSFSHYTHTFPLSLLHHSLLAARRAKFRAGAGEGVENLCEMEIFMWTFVKFMDIRQACLSFFLSVSYKMAAAESWSCAREKKGLLDGVDGPRADWRCESGNDK